MKPRHRGTGLLLALLSALTLTLLGTAPASASASTWTLEAEGQRICANPTYGWHGAYVFAPVSGSWSNPIQVGVSDLPPGSSSEGGSTIPPGTNERDPVDGGLVVNGFVGLSIAPAPAGEYVAEIWATDGTRTQTDTLLITLRNGC
ncbi:DUF5980 family protein [Streptomyces sp. DSM 44915]|uniref:DUF5980 family protein n=1 Tax=Streptomyces chisholmiae TaxID=3075540 RepID=A0ABU2JZ63_9ACTN|nr:DUF5980 family protein [Streptomyces sp. DSM 44915]MDT0270043.1 DUF5980 family protein [Streptomyces sp. DSM 44915]